MNPCSLLLCGFVAVSGLLSSAATAAARPVVLYSQYFNAPGENRYPADGAYKPILDAMQREFEVRVDARPLTFENLRDVAVVLVANPNDKAFRNNPPPHHVAENDIRQITAFVEHGGGLIVMANQENHNLEVNHMNRLLAHFGLQFTNVYTDAKMLKIPPAAPVIGGLRWAYYTGNLLLIEPSHPAHPFAIVTNDLAQKPAKGTRDAAGILLAGATPARGHVLAVTDSGWVADWALNEKGVGGVSIHGQDNEEIFLRLVRWAAGKRGSAAKAQDSAGSVPDK